MSDAISKAKELGTSIVKSREFISFQQAKSVLESQGLLSAAAQYENAKAIVDSDKFEKSSKVYSDAKEIYDKYYNDGKIQEYTACKRQLQFLLDGINAALTHVTGMETGVSCGGCGGSCGGCSKK